MMLLSTVKNLGTRRLVRQMTGKPSKLATRDFNRRTVLGRVAVTCCVFGGVFLGTTLLLQHGPPRFDPMPWCKKEEKK